jgi:hypothetical protein
VVLEGKYAELSRIHQVAVSHTDVVQTDPKDRAQATRILPVSGVVVLRCVSVQVTGVLWLLVGAGAAMFGAALLGSAGSRLWFGVAGCVAGLVLCITGLTFLQARIEITRDAIVSYWALGHHEYPLANLADATLAQPFRKSNRGAGSVDWVTPGGNGLIFLAGYLLLFTFRILAWIAIPGSSSGEMLHLIPRRGGAIPVPSISTRVERKDDSAHHALAMIRTAIRANAQRDVVRSPFDPAGGPWP